MTTARASITSTETTENLLLWIRRCLEALWLLTIIMVPLAFFGRDSLVSESELAYVDLPKTGLLRVLVGLMAVLWLLEWGLQGRFPSGHFAKEPKFRPGAMLRSITGWLRDQPTRWLTLAVVLYLGSTLISTALSASFSVSMWGLIPGQDTYPAYTIIAYVLLFGVIATHLKTRAQLGRLLAAIVIMGVLVGGYSMAQHYDHDVFNLNDNPGTHPSTSTMGNPILASAVLLMTTLISLVAAVITLQEPLASRRFWGTVGLWTLILTVQLLGIIFSFSRGPLFGTLAGLVGFLALVGIFVSWRTLGRTCLVLGLAAALTAIIVMGPPRLAREYTTPTAIEPAITLSFPESEAARIADRFTSAGREVGGGGLSSRLQIWKVSRRLMFHRPWFEFDSLTVPFLRPLVGYGPDLFKYTYLLERRPLGEDKRLVSNRFGHNIFLHKGVELGILGLLASLGVFVAFFVVAGYQIFQQGQSNSLLQKLLVAGLLATLAGRLLEQMVGVAAVSDLTISWALLGVFAALPTVMKASRTEPNPQSQPRLDRRPRRRPSATRWRPYDVQPAWRMVVVACLIAGIGVLAWSKTINYPWAAVVAREGLEHIRDGDLQGALYSFDRAIDLAPDVPVYYNLQAAVYSAYLQSNQLTEIGCDQRVDIMPYETCLARKAYEIIREGTAQRPFDWRSRLAQAESALTLASLERDADLTDEAVRLHREVAELDPQAWWRWQELGAVNLQVGRPEEALLALERSLALVGSATRSGHSLVLQGIVYRQLGQAYKALEVFDEAIRLGDIHFVPQAYTNRGATYNDLGQYHRAIEDLDEAIRLQPGFAMGYINRGNAYGNLDQLERAISDYDEAIRLDPRFALAYSNRALAYTYLGRDSEAQLDVERAMELGTDTTPLLAKIEEVKNSR